MKEVVRRGKDTALRGVKANYAVRVGQQQSRRTENRKEQHNVAALREGIQGGNAITNWFQKQPLMHERTSAVGASIAKSQSVSVEVEESSEEEVSLPPSTRASTCVPSPVGSQSSETGSGHDIAQSSADERVAGNNLPDAGETVAGLVDCDDEQSECPQVPEKGLFEPPPSIAAARSALEAIKLVLKPYRDTRAGYKDPHLNLMMR